LLDSFAIDNDHNVAMDLRASHDHLISEHFLGIFKVYTLTIPFCGEYNGCGATKMLEQSILSKAIPIDGRKI
jgi:hypothetical protein